MKKILIISFMFLLTFSLSSCGKENLMVADAALYRGVVTELEKDYFVLTQEDGRNYGKESIKLLLDKDTKYNESAKKIKLNIYVEAYYSEMQEDGDANALAVNILGDVEDFVFNGTITEINEISENSGAFMLKTANLDTETEIYFAKDGTTNFYMNMDELVIGANVSVFSDGDKKGSKIVASEVVIIK